MFAVQMSADLLVILSDVDGIYTGPPGEEGSSLLSVYRPSDKNLVRYSQVKSRVGTGGMESKVISFFFVLKAINSFESSISYFFTFNFCSIFISV